MKKEKLPELQKSFNKWAKGYLSKCINSYTPFDDAYIDFLTYSNRGHIYCGISELKFRKLIKSWCTLKDLTFNPSSLTNYNNRIIMNIHGKSREYFYIKTKTDQIISSFQKGLIIIGEKGSPRIHKAAEFTKGFDRREYEWIKLGDNNFNDALNKETPPKVIVIDGISDLNDINTYSDLITNGVKLDRITINPLIVFIMSPKIDVSQLPTSTSFKRRYDVIVCYNEN